MKKFRFPLQSALNYRQHREELEEMKLGELRAEKVGLSDHQRDLLEKIRKAEDDRASRRSLTSQDLEIYNRYIESLRERFEKTGLAIKGLESKIRAQRRRLVEATQKRKTLDRLKTRQKSAHQKESERVLQQESDDLFLIRMKR